MLQANFFTANIEIKKKLLRKLRIYFFTDEFSLKACSLEPYLTVIDFALPKKNLNKRLLVFNLLFWKPCYDAEKVQEVI